MKIGFMQGSSSPIENNLIQPFHPRIGRMKYALLLKIA